MQFKINLVTDSQNIRIGPDEERFTPTPGAPPMDPIRNDYKTRYYAGSETSQVVAGSEIYSRDVSYSAGGGPKISIWPWNTDIISGFIPTVAPEYEINYTPPAIAYGIGASWGTHSETIVIAGDPILFEAQGAWESHVRNNYIPGTSCADHSHYYNSPYTLREQIVGALGDSPTATAQVRLDYNFYLPSYESAIDYSAENENVLPLLYNFYLDTQRLAESTFYTTTAPADDPLGRPVLNAGLYYDFITLDGNISGPLWEVIDRDPRRHSFDGADINYIARTSGRYYDGWARAYTPIANSSAPLELGSRYRNIFVPAQTVISMRNMNSNASMFPMFAEIEFTLPDQRSPLTRASVDEPNRIYERLSWVPAGAEDVPELAEGYIGNIMRGAFVDSDDPGAVEWRANLPSDIVHPREPVYTQGVQFVESTQTTSTTVDGSPVTSTRTQFTTRSTMNFGQWMANEAAGVGVSLDHGPSRERRSTDVRRERAPGYEWPNGNPVPYVYLRNFLEGSLPDFFEGSIVEELAQTTWGILRQYGMPTSDSPGLFRSYRDVLSGVTAYSEDLYFKVSKYRVSDNGARYGDPIQTYYLPNVRAYQDQIRLIDTQLKYEESYEYEITTCRLVLGSNSTITNVEIAVDPDFLSGRDLRLSAIDAGWPESGIFPVRWQDITTGDTTSSVTTIKGAWFPGFATTLSFARVTVETVPSIQLIELPYVTQGPNTSTLGGTVLDDPPLAPDVAINFYKGVNNKIVFNFNTGIGSEQQVPIPLSAPEQTYFGQIQQRNEDPNQATILFENDDPSVNFEISRLAEHPRTYLDFAQGVKFQTSTVLDVIDYKKASSAAFTDTIRPNTKYYYMFRAFDVHGHVSNPSAVYEIELVDNEGAIFPRIRTVPLLGDEDRKNSIKNLRRFLQIKPQVSQALIDFSAPGMSGLTSAPIGSDGTLPVGIDEVSVWGKRFKIRLTSRKTGKKIDLNIKFKQEYDDTRSTDSEGVAMSSPPDDSDYWPGT